ncbi:MAG: hypothetical protein QXE80_08785 [Pyrobaculum sp.]
MKYKQTKNPVVLEQIQQKVAPLMRKFTQMYAASGLDNDLLETQLVIYLKQAIEAYDNKKGPFEAFLPRYFQQIYRFVNNYQSPVRLPEHYKLQYGEFEKVKNVLEEQLGRSPTISELSAATGFPRSQIKTFLSRSVGALQEDSWTIAYDDKTLRQKEALAHIEAKFGPSFARAIEEVEIKGVKLSEYCRRHNIDYSSFYPKYRQAKEDYEWFLNS